MILTGKFTCPRSGILYLLTSFGKILNKLDANFGKILKKEKRL